MNTIFEVKISYNRWDEEKEKDSKVKESYIIDAFSYSEAEAAIMKIIEEDKLKDVVINSIKTVNIREIFLDKDADSSTDDGNVWCKCKIAIVGYISDKGVKKINKSDVLIKGKDIKDALDNLKRNMTETVDDWDSVAITVTNIYKVILK